MGKIYEILSPDRFHIEREILYYSEEEALNAIEDFVKKFEHQGYYSDAKGNKIPLEDIRSHMEIIEHKRFNIEAKYTFKAIWTIVAKDKSEAIEYVKKHCGCVSPNYHSVLSEDQIDWIADVHPEKETFKTIK